jgi:hypothetical protein
LRISCKIMYLLSGNHSSSSDDAFSVQYDVAAKLFEEIICVKHLQGCSKIPLDEMWPLVRLGRPVCHTSVWCSVLLLTGTFYSTSSPCLGLPPMCTVRDTIFATPVVQTPLITPRSRRYCEKSIMTAGVLLCSRATEHIGLPASVHVRNIASPMLPFVFATSASNTPLDWVWSDALTSPCCAISHLIRWCRLLRASRRPASSLGLRSTTPLIGRPCPSRCRVVVLRAYFPSQYCRTGFVSLFRSFLYWCYIANATS